MKEENLRKCKVCNELKLRARSGKYPNAKDSKFIDENGRLWSGNVCPTCHANACKVKQKEKRSTEEIKE